MFSKNKFEQADFADTNHLLYSLEDLCQKKIQLSEVTFKGLLAAKSRRHPYFHGVYIIGQDESFYRNGFSRSLNTLLKQIANQTLGRTQILYRSNFHNHYLGFDVERKANGKLSIFCIESAHYLEAQMTIIHRLQRFLNDEKIDCEIIMCVAKLQPNNIHSGFLQYAILCELAKHSDFHQGLKHAMVVAEPTISANPNFFIENAKWISVEDLPKKIVNMNQAYYQSRYDKNLFFLRDCVNQKNPLWSLLISKKRISVENIKVSFSNYGLREKINLLTNGADQFYQDNTLYQKGDVLDISHNINMMRIVLLEWVSSYRHEKGTKFSIPKSIIVDCEHQFLLDEFYKVGSEVTLFRAILVCMVNNDVKKQEELLERYKHIANVRDMVLLAYGSNIFYELVTYGVSYTLEDQDESPSIMSELVRLPAEKFMQLMALYPDQVSLPDIDVIDDFLKEHATNIQDTQDFSPS